MAPPPPNGGHGEGTGVMVCADIYEASVPADVVDAIGISARNLGAGETMDFFSWSKMRFTQTFCSKKKLLLLEKIIPKDLDFKIEYIQGVQKLLPAIELMKRSMKNKVGIIELSKSVHLERNYFSTLFKKVLGVSPIIYYHQLRCKSAQSLLQNRAITIEAIAQELGFVDAFHF